MSCERSFLLGMLPEYWTDAALIDVTAIGSGGSDGVYDHQLSALRLRFDFPDRFNLRVKDARFAHKGVSLVAFRGGHPLSRRSRSSPNAPMVNDVGQ